MRRKLTLKDKLEIVLRYTPCPMCGEILGNDVEYDHIQQLALGGGDTNDCYNPLHKACHARKSFGSKATTLGSDAHARGKSRRVRKKLAEHQARMGAKGEPKEEQRRYSRWPKRKMRG